MLVHAGGCLTVLLWIEWQLIQLRRITRHAQLVKDAELCAEFAGVSEQLDLRHRPRLMVSTEVHAPIAFGLLRPTVMLPSSVIQKLPMAEIRTILAHELAHYRRSDLWINWLQLILLAVWWFNPVLWLLNRTIRKVREDCCDDLLLARGLTSNDAYCDVLVRAAAELSRRTSIGTALGFADDVHPLGRRVARIMDRTIRRYHKVSAFGVLLLFALGGLLLPGLKSQTAEQGHLSSAKGAVSFQPGATPQENAKSQKSNTQSRSIAEVFNQLTIRGNGLMRSQAELLNEFLRSPSIVPFLIQQLANKTSPNKVEAAKSRAKAAWLLSEIGIPAKPAIPALVKGLEDDDQWAAQSAADALGALGSEARETIPALIQSLKLENHGAASALVKIATESPQVATAIIEAFEDTGYPHRIQLLYSMSDLKVEKERLEKTLIAAQQEPEADIRSTSAFALKFQHTFRS